MNYLSSLYSLIDSPCKILIKSENANRSKVMMGLLKEISIDKNIIHFLHDGKIDTIPLDAIVAIKSWKK